MGMTFISGTSAILLNGVPGKVFRCRLGVRQGDPLSPLLFVLAATRRIIGKHHTPLDAGWGDFHIYIAQYGLVYKTQHIHGYTFPNRRDLC